MISLLCIMLFSWMDKKNNEFEVNMDTQIGLVLDSDDFFLQNLFNDVKENFKLSLVNDYNEGIELLKKNSDYICYIHSDDKIHIVQQEESEVTEYIKGYIESSLYNNKDYEVEFLADEREKLDFSKFSILISFICIYMGYRVIYDEKNTIEYLLLSPEKNANIINAKFVSVVFFYFLSCCGYCFFLGESKSEVLFMFFFGCLFIPLGLLMGVYSRRKFISGLAYVLVFIVLLFLLYSNSLHNLMNNLFEWTKEGFREYLVYILSILGLTGVFEIIVCLCFEEYIKHMRVNGT